MKNFNCNRCKDRNFLIQCKCGRCEDIISSRDERGRKVNYKRFHHANWKGGRYKYDNYWFIRLPNYFSSYANGYTLEHVYIFQEHYKCCMLPWGDIHHIDGNTDNNQIFNLKAMMKKDHTILHKTKDKSDRKCFYCNDVVTNHWRKLNDDWICHRCYMREYHKSRRK